MSNVPRDLHLAVCRERDAAASEAAKWREKAITMGAGMIGVSEANEEIEGKLCALKRERDAAVAEAGRLMDENERLDVENQRRCENELKLAAQRDTAETARIAAHRLTTTAMMQAQDYREAARVAEARADRFAGVAADMEKRALAAEVERDEMRKKWGGYPTLSARLHDREKAREAEQKACRAAIDRALAAEGEVERLKAIPIEYLVGTMERAMACRVSNCDVFYIPPYGCGSGAELLASLKALLPVPETQEASNGDR